jgi:hypothetical protein
MKKNLPKHIDCFTKLSYESFNKRLKILTTKSSIRITNEGIIPVETYLYFIYLQNENWLDIISYVINHEGSWRFELHCDNKELVELIKRVHRFQEVDEFSQLTIYLISQKISLIFGEE